MRKKILYGFLVLLMLLFSLMNYIAYKHSYNFTHYAYINQNKLKVYDTSKISWQEKVGYIVNGVQVPRPQNKFWPLFNYSTEYINTPQGKIEIWRSELEGALGTVIMFHGYANKKSSLLGRSSELLELGYNVVLVDFLGSGGSDGNRVTVGCQESKQVLACYNHVRKSGEQNIYLFGISMGAVSIMKCMKQDHPEVKGIIVECPFGYFKTTITNRFKNFGIPSFPMADLLMIWGSYQTGYNIYRHNPVEYAKNIQCPTLLLYGEKDHVVKREEIDEIYSNLKGEKYLKTFENTGHDIFIYQNERDWINTLEDFMINTKTLDKKREYILFEDTNGVIHEYRGTRTIMPLRDNKDL